MADLTVLINEKITLDGNDRGVLTTQTITGINNIDNRIVTLEADYTANIFYFTDVNSPAAATFTTGSFKYGRITNKSTVPVQLSVYNIDFVNDSNYYSSTFVITPGNSFILSSTDTTGSLPPNFSFNDYIQSILITPSGSAATIEYFIATT